VANYNLIRLSSVIPPGWTPVPAGTRPVHPGGQWGDRLYVVMADQRARRPGQEAWAGIGWVRDRRSGRGLFVEHEGEDEGQVRADIAASLAALCAGRRESFGPARSVVKGTVCEGQPVCALVVAVYAVSPWTAPEPVLHLP
jgi:arginine decarboxylase